MLTSVDTVVPKVEGHLRGPCLVLWWMTALVCEEVAESAQEPAFCKFKLLLGFP